MTKTVLKVAMKNHIFALFGCFFAAILHAERIRYSIVSAVKPIAASSFACPKYFRVWITTKYVEALVLKSVEEMPKSAGT